MSHWLESRRGMVTGVLFVGTLSLLIVTLDDPGLTWDEPEYFASAQLQARWVERLFHEGPGEALTRSAIVEMWDWHHYYNPHPPLYKEPMALTWTVARGWLGWIPAFRLPSAILFSLLVALMFLWGTAAWSGVAGLGAALSLLTMPRLFGHAHLGATETPLLTTWAIAAMAVWWAVERDRRWAWVVAGVAWALAAGTKFTGLAAMVVPAVWAVMYQRKRAIPGLTLAFATAIVVFVALNPLVWVDGIKFFRTWFSESLNREQSVPIWTYYMGRVWGFHVPWHHPFVMTAVVTPLGILIMALLGMALGSFRRDRLVVLAVGSVVFAWTVMSTPKAPYHDGIRQFVYLFPFLAVLAGYAFHEVERRRCRSFVLVVLGLVLVPPVIQIAWIHPFYLSYYNELVGGVRGANERGFETTYWMDAIENDTIQWMNAHLPPESEVVVIGPPVVLERGQSYGRVRRDLRFKGEPPGDFLLVPESQSLVSTTVRDAVRGVPPVYRKELAGVPLVSIYTLAPDSGVRAPEATGSSP